MTVLEAAVHKIRILFFYVSIDTRRYDIFVAMNSGNIHDRIHD